MCGRFATTLPHDAMARLFGAAPDNDLPPVPDFNVCPTQQIAVVRQATVETTVGAGDAGRRLVPMRWGFLPGWYKSPTDGPLLINARAETIADKPAFAQSCRSRRCLVPAGGFYEWHREENSRLPFFIRRTDGEPLVMAGIWQDWGAPGEQVSTCAIVTTEANGVMAPIHHRMPVILDPGDWGKWLGEAGKGAARLMLPAREDMLEAYRVGREVNSNRAAGPGLIEPLQEA